MRLILLILLLLTGFVSGQAPVSVDAFGEETYAFSGSPGGFKRGPGNGSVSVGNPATELLQWRVQRINDVYWMSEPLAAFVGLNTIEIPIFYTNHGNPVDLLFRFYRDGGWSTWTVGGVSADIPVEGASASEFLGESQLSYKVKNATGEPVGFTWALSVPSQGGTWVSGSQASTGGRTMGSTVYDLADGASAVLNGVDNLIAYEWRMRPAEGVGENVVSLPGELTVMMQGEYGQTYVFDITRVFNMSVSVGSDGASGSGPFPQGAYEFEIVLSPGPVVTSLTLAYQLRNSTNEAQPLRLHADGQSWDFGTVPPTAAGGTVVPLSQQVTVLQSDLAGKAWEVKLGNRVVGSGTFGETGPFVATVTGEVGGTKDGYEYLDGHWVPRGGGENPTLPPSDGSSEEPTPGVSPDASSKPGESVPAMAKSVSEGVQDALSKARAGGTGPGYLGPAGGVTFGVGQSLAGPATAAVPAASYSLGSGMVSGFQFAMLGRTYDFDLAEAGGASWVPLVRQILLWVVRIWFVLMLGRLIINTVS